MSGRAYAPEHQACYACLLRTVMISSLLLYYFEQLTISAMSSTDSFTVHHSQLAGNRLLDCIACRTAIQRVTIGKVLNGVQLLSVCDGAWLDCPQADATVDQSSSEADPCTLQYPMTSK